MTKVKNYLREGLLPEDKKEKQKTIKESSKYVLLTGILYIRGVSNPLLRCVTQEEAKQIMEALHEGICGSHIGSRALSLRILRDGYYWPTIRSDCSQCVKKCDNCQRHANIHRAPPENLQVMYAPWPFYKWGVDTLGPFLLPSSSTSIQIFNCGCGLFF